MTTLQKAWKHFKTVSKHRRIVRNECAACGLFWQGLVHDLSKYSKAEFLPSAKYFQGTRSPIEAEKDEAGYSAAWLHHKGHNKHHWEYWTDFANDGSIIANEIPLKYVIEMICDWIGAGQAYASNGDKNWTQHEPLAYFEKVKAGRHFHEITLERIYYYLNLIDQRGLDEFHKVAKVALQIDRNGRKEK